MCSILKNYFPYSEAFLALDFSVLIFRTCFFFFPEELLPPHPNPDLLQKYLWTFLQMSPCLSLHRCKNPGSIISLPQRSTVELN